MGSSSTTSLCEDRRPGVLLLYNVDPSWPQKDILDALSQARTILEALSEKVPRVREVRVEDQLLAMRLSAFDPREWIVLNWCEEIPGLERSEHLVPVVLETLGFHYTGSPGDVLALSWEKTAIKTLLAKMGIPTPAWKTFEIPDQHDWRVFPAIVKPAREHCSIGLTPQSVVMDIVELCRQVERVVEELRQPALVEDFIDGPEFHVTLWGNGLVEMLPPAEMDFSCFQDPRERLCTFDSKFEPGSRHYEGIQVRIPARLSPEQRGELEEVVRRAYLAVGCRDYARLDVRMRDGVFYVLDVNPNPDLAADTTMALCAEQIGYSYGAMLQRLIDLALERSRDPIIEGPRRALLREGTKMGSALRKDPGWCY